MAKGLLDYEDPRALGTVGLQSRDYSVAGFDDADVVITIGYDLVEHAPEHWNPRRDKKIIVIDSVAAEIDEFYLPEVELIGDIAHVLTKLAGLLPGRSAVGAQSGSSRLHDVVMRALQRRARRRPLPDAAASSAVGHPPRARSRGHARVRRRPAQAAGSAGCSPLTSPARC